VAKIDAAKLGEYIREQRTSAQISLRQLAKTAGVSNPYLSQVERGLRISAETLYVRAGILEERSGDIAVLTAITDDPTLTDRQRRTLLEIYAAFQTENSALREQAGNTEEEE
jgi:transcriptional regulator with XRE-family HTH domain